MLENLTDMGNDDDGHIDCLDETIKVFADGVNCALATIVQECENRVCDQSGLRCKPDA